MMRNDSAPRCEVDDHVSPPSKSYKDLQVQLVLSLILGISAFITFSILRPRWPSLYAARKRRLDPKISLPALSDSFFGWMPRLYKVTEDQILASAGLDAFVFLTFFKMAIRLFIIMGFFATVVLMPINSKFRGGFVPDTGNNTDGNGTDSHFRFFPGFAQLSDDYGQYKSGHIKDKSGKLGYLWSYVIFTYFFVGLTIYFINWETFRIVRYRQTYLGTQSTVTDRTFRLTGIPEKLRSEERLRKLIEKLEIGHVDTVTMCRDWKQLDELVATRDQCLRRLETAWAKYLKQQEECAKNGNGSEAAANTSSGISSQTPQEDEELGENGRLMGNNADCTHDTDVERPQVVLRHGIFGVRSRKVDAIDYYEEKLRRLDEKVVEARKQEFAPMDMALVTMDSVASCQMVIQARIDPRPGQLLTKATPSPSDLVWKNTYASRGIRRLKSWAVTLFITALTLVFIFPTAFLASLLSICAIRTAAPSFATWLESHSIIYSLFQNGVPTLVVSLLNVAVPYLYDWLSNHQGMISQGDVELSVISKNFFFTFFNTFFVFAISRTGVDFLSTLQGFLKDTSKIPRVIADDVEQMSIFFTNFIVLQGIGLMPFRILEVGSVFLYPIYRLLSSTPRDYAELERPPVFQYGFYLPTALLVFNLCLIYSVLRFGFVILFFGTLYFTLGYFTFKYMVLYAMDQPQHATGGAWRIICYRIVIGLLVFEVVMVGQIATLAAFVQSVAILPLIPFTIWYSYYFSRRFEPLTKYIALRAIRDGYESENEAVTDGLDDDEDDVDDIESRVNGPHPSLVLLRRGSTLDELKEKGLTFVNPSLVIPLQQPWIYKDPPPTLSRYEASNQTGESLSEEHPRLILPNADSSLGIGEDNVWSDNGGR